ncbi:7457_t:CDS:2, partial [Gigaspora margarita]
NERIRADKLDLKQENERIRAETQSSYLYVVSVDQNKIKAYDLFQELVINKSDQQNSAKFGLAKNYQTEPLYYKMAFQLYLDLSKCKSDQQNSAKYELARCNESSKGVIKDADKACSLYLDLLTSEDFHILIIYQLVPAKLSRIIASVEVYKWVKIQENLKSEHSKRHFQYHKEDILIRRLLLRARIKQLELFIKENGLAPPTQEC